jgi:transcriptional regulator with XRE-family HTH domain
MAADRYSFGRALKALRQSKGISQKEIVNLGIYSDDSAYRRVERGDRIPERDTVIAILTRGLSVKDVSRIDELLELAGYEGLRNDEIARYGLSVPSTTREPAVAQGPPEAKTPPTPARLLAAFAVAASTVVIAVLSSGMWWVGAVPVWFPLVTSAGYAMLYCISVLLETAYTESRQPATTAGSLVFALMFLTSLVALNVNVRLASAGSGAEGFVLALATFICAAALQWALLRRTLPDQVVVRARFSAQTAQAAHLKNTAYFLLFVLLFWLPTLHCIVSIHHELGRGRHELVRRLLDGNASLFAGGVYYPRPLWLWVIFMFVVGLSVPMGARLLDNLEPHPAQNRFLTLFYLRALLYFAVCVICLVWYSYSLGHIGESLIDFKSS